MTHSQTLTGLFVFETKYKQDFFPLIFKICHRSLLKVLVGFLYELAQHEAKTKMTLQNLAICFAPNLLSKKQQNEENGNISKIVEESELAVNITRVLLQYYESIFNVLLTLNNFF